MPKRLTKYYRLAATPMLPKQGFYSSPMYSLITQTSSSSAAKTGRTVLPNWQHSSARTAQFWQTEQQPELLFWQELCAKTGSTVLPEQRCSGCKYSSQNTNSGCAYVSEQNPVANSSCAGMSA